MMPITSLQRAGSLYGQDIESPVPLKFGSTDGLHRELRRRVGRYFEKTGRRQRDCPAMYLKTAITLGWLAASYGFLVFGANTWWSALPLALSLGLAMACAGFNIQHDGGHGAYSNHRWV